MWLDDCDLRRAVERLTNAPLPLPATKRAPDKKPAEKQPADWHMDAQNIADHAHWRLFDDKDADAQAARNYLEGRGLQSHTWQVFKLGFAPKVSIPGTEGKERAPAIVIPWYRAGRLCAIRYRFLEKQGDHKQTALFGSSFSGVMFGGQVWGNNIPELSTLLICEGELNACSIWQASQYTHLDVLSMGSETATIPPAMIEHANKYANVICWFDKEEIAIKAAELLPNAHPVKSPGGKDANDLLQAGLLGAFLAIHREKACKNNAERERLLWDLCDAACGWYGVDQQTAKVIEQISKLVNKPVRMMEAHDGKVRVTIV